MVASTVAQRQPALRAATAVAPATATGVPPWGMPEWFVISQTALPASRTTRPSQGSSSRRSIVLTAPC